MKSWTMGFAFIFVHGRSGSNQDFDSLVRSVPKLAQQQRAYFSYDDLYQPLKSSAQALAQTIKDTREKSVTVIAHSMGGLVAREALNLLAQAKDLTDIPSVRVITIDTPWQGGTMLFCDKKSKTMGRISSLVLPAAIDDMYSCSNFFENIYSVAWPQKFSLEIYFAKEGTQALDYSEAPLQNIPQKIAAYFNDQAPINGNTYEINFCKALWYSTPFKDFAKEILRKKESARITSSEVRALLEKYFPRFPGDHVSIMSPHAESPTDFPANLQNIL